MYKSTLFIFLLSVSCYAQADKVKGRFVGTVHAEWLKDGRVMKLTKDFAYVDTKKFNWHVPAGTEVDGASIPRIFWSIIGGPFEGRYRNASVVHDYYCIKKSRSWEDVHRMFYEACLDGGVVNIKAKIMYAAVYMKGPRWDYPSIACTDCPSIQQQDYEYGTPEGLENEIFDWVEKENPSIDEIQSLLDTRIHDLRRSLTVETTRFTILLGEWKAKSPEKSREYSERAEKILEAKLILDHIVFVGLPSERLISDLRKLNDEMESAKK